MEGSSQASMEGKKMKGKMRVKMVQRIELSKDLYALQFGVGSGKPDFYRVYNSSTNIQVATIYDEEILNKLRG
jgi:hypothetical protein